MKSVTFAAALGLFFSLATHVGSQQSGVGIQLRGIADLGEKPLALLELSVGRAGEQDLLLAKGERQGETEVLEIEPAAGRVKIKTGLETRELVLPPATVAEPAQSLSSTTNRVYLRLHQAGPGLVFPVYQQLTRRTLLRSAGLPDFRLDLAVNAPVTASQAQAALEGALAGKGVFLQPDRDKFALAVVSPSFAPLPAGLWELAGKLGARDRASSGPGEEQLPPGLMDFRNFHLIQALVLYQELAGRTLIRPATIPMASISFKTATTLSRAEALYVLHASFYLNGVSVFPAGDKFLLVMPTAQAQEAESVIAQKPVVSAAATNALPAGTLNLSWADLRQVATFYEQLSGREVEVDPAITTPRFTLRTQTSLSPAEMLRALDLLLGCNHLAAVPSANGLKIIRYPREL